MRKAPAPARFLLLSLIILAFPAFPAVPSSAQDAPGLAGIHDSLHAATSSLPEPGRPDPETEPAADTTKAGKVLATVESFADFLLKYFIALAAVGALAMALIELVKKLTEWRTRHYARAVTKWLDGDKAAFGDLLHLTTGMERDKAVRTASELADKEGAMPILGVAEREDSALFSLELDQMMGHIQDAVDIALGNPAAFEALYGFATRGASPDDVRDWKPIVREADPDLDAVQSKKRADIYTRLHQIVKRKLDAFQLATGRRWVNRNQTGANIVGGKVMFGCLWWLDSAGAWGQSTLTMFILSLMGGVLSPVAKDIVIALKKVRGG